MKRALILTAAIIALALAIPRGSAACYDTCAGAPGTCRQCETGFDLTFQVCIQTSECKCITYFVPSYQCIGLSAGEAASSTPAFLLDEAREQISTAADPAFLAP